MGRDPNFLIAMSHLHRILVLLKFQLVLKVMLVIPLCVSLGDGASSRVLFETGFERFEGYDTAIDLVDAKGKGQNGWTSVGYGGNGILSEIIPDFSGQYAYVGFQTPTNMSGFFNVFRPINFKPVSNAAPVLVFQVLMSLRDALPSPATADDFRWSVYTPDDRRLFTLDFHGPDQSITYALDDEVGFRASGYDFDYGATYQLEISMSFARNKWSASLNGYNVVFEQSISTTNKPLALGSVDCVWAANGAGTWDDNYLIFDNYRIIALPASGVAPVLEVVSSVDSKPLQLRIWGEPNVFYRVQSSNDLFTWVDRAVVEANSPDGLALFTETQVAASRNYRAISVP